MAKNQTVQVVATDDGWTVGGQGRKRDMYSTQAAAIKAVRHIVRDSIVGQFVVLKRDGEIVKHVTHGLPKVQNPPGKPGGKKKIQNAVGRFAIERAAADSYPPRG